MPLIGPHPYYCAAPPRIRPSIHCPGACRPARVAMRQHKPQIAKPHGKQPVLCSLDETISTYRCCLKNATVRRIASSKYGESISCPPPPYW